MNLPQLSHRQKIIILIQTFIDQFVPGDMLRTEDVIKYVHRYHHRYIYGDTILRYMRDMRKRGDINYTIVSKRERTIKILLIGEDHSL